MTKTALNISQLVKRVRHFGMFRVKLAHLGKRLAGGLKIAFGQVHFAQPVLGVARVLAIRVFAQKGCKCLTGLVEILGFDQVESSIVIELFFRRIARFRTGSYLRCRRCIIAGGRSTTRRRIIRSGGRSNARSNATIKFLVTLQVFLFHARNIILQNFDHTLLARICSRLLTLKAGTP